MARWNCALRVGAVALVGFLGGIVSNSLFHGEIQAIAKNKPDVQDEVVSQRFTLVDKAGKTRAVLSVNDKNETNLTLLDQKEEARLSVHLRADGRVFLGMIGPDNKVGLTLSVDENCYPMVMLTKGGGGYYIGFSSKTGSPRMLLTGKNNEVLWEAP